MTPRKVGVGLKRRRELSKSRLAWWGSTEKKEASHLLRLRKTPVLRPALQSKQSSLCGLHCSRDRGGGGPNGQILSVKRAADERKHRSRKIIDEEREKHRGKNEFLQNISKGTTFVTLKDHASAPIRKESLSPTSKGRREASRNEFMEKCGVPDRVKSFGEIDSSEDRPRARPGFVKSIRDGLRKIQNLM